MTLDGYFSQVRAQRMILPRAVPRSVTRFLLKVQTACASLWVVHYANSGILDTSANTSSTTTIINDRDFSALLLSQSRKLSISTFGQTTYRHDQRNDRRPSKRCSDHPHRWHRLRHRHRAATANTAAQGAATCSNKRGQA